MKKVTVQILNARSGFVTSGVISDPVEDGLELRNALSRFGIIAFSVESAVCFGKTKMITGKVLDADIFYTAIIFNNEVQEQA